LAHVSFLAELLPALKKKKFRVYLETAGVHPKNLARVVRDCDVIAMDIKLPSATGRVYWREHEQFVEEAEGKLFVKVVIERQSKKSEFERAVGILSKRPVSPLLVIQPVTPGNPGVDAPSAKQLGDFYALAARKLRKVLVMPQQHKLWGLR
jgi:organic radical activating enzyme